MKYTTNKIMIGTLWLAVAAGPPAGAEVTVLREAAHDELTLFKMTITPAAEPVPALQHRLQLRPAQYQAGNAATHYLRSFAENGLRDYWKHLRKEHGDEVDAWCRITDVSLGDLPLEQARAAASSFDYVISQFIRPATNRPACDWGLQQLELRGLDVISLPLPEFQASREICRALALRTRVAIAEGRYEAAIDHLRMNYQLSRHVGSAPLIVCGLIGLAEASIANQTVIDLIAAPNSPNLYWALTELPQPLVNMDEAVRQEVSIGLRVFPVLLDVETAEHSPQEWARLISAGLIDYEQLTTGALFQGISLAKQDTLRGFSSMGLSMLIYPAAKQRLLNSGMEPERVEQMPVGQVVLLDAAREYQRIADELEKWLYVSYPLAKQRMQQANQELFGKGNLVQGGFGALIADTLFPAIQALNIAQTRTAWQIAALRVIEAIRMHAAVTGELPATLDDIQVVPVPLNPITGKPYLYQWLGNMGQLDLPLSDGMPGVAWRFEIRLAP